MLGIFPLGRGGVAFNWRGSSLGFLADEEPKGNESATMIRFLEGPRGRVLDKALKGLRTALLFLFGALSLTQTGLHYAQILPKREVMNVTASSRAIASARNDEIGSLIYTPFMANGKTRVSPLLVTTASMIQPAAEHDPIRVPPSE